MAKKSSKKEDKKVGQEKRVPLTKKSFEHHFDIPEALLVIESKNDQEITGKLHGMIYDKDNRYYTGDVIIDVVTTSESDLFKALQDIEDNEVRIVLKTSSLFIYPK